MHAVRAPVNDAACVLCGGARARALFVKGGWTFVRCEGCDLVSLRPIPTPAEVEAHHAASYRDGPYAAFAAADHVRAAIARRRLTLLRPLTPAGPWLDVGCSNGTFVAEAAGAGLVVEGLELSAAAVAAARARGLVVHRGAVERFVPSRRYAVVTAFDVVEHLPDPASFLGRVGSWMVAGGVLALTLPDAASPAARLMGRHWFYYAPPDHIHYFTQPTICRLLDRHGFRDVAVRRITKPLTLDYATGQLAQLAPALAPIARLVGTLLPRPWRVRPWPLPLGEMLVTARAGA